MALCVNLDECKSFSDIITRIRSFGKCVDVGDVESFKGTKKKIVVGTVIEIYPRVRPKSLEGGRCECWTMMLKTFGPKNKKGIRIRVVFLGDIVHRLELNQVHEKDVLCIINPKLMKSPSSLTLVVGPTHPIPIVWHCKPLVKFDTLEFDGDFPEQIMNADEEVANVRDRDKDETVDKEKEKKKSVKSDKNEHVVDNLKPAIEDQTLDMPLSVDNSEIQAEIVKPASVTKSNKAPVKLKDAANKPVTITDESQTSSCRCKCNEENSSKNRIPNGKKDRYNVKCCCLKLILKLDTLFGCCVHGTTCARNLSILELLKMNAEGNSHRHIKEGPQHRHCWSPINKGPVSQENFENCESISENDAVRAPSSLHEEECALPRLEHASSTPIPNRTEEWVNTLEECGLSVDKGCERSPKRRISPEKVTQPQIRKKLRLFTVPEGSDIFMKDVTVPPNSATNSPLSKMNKSPEVINLIDSEHSSTVEQIEQNEDSEPTLDLNKLVQDSDSEEEEDEYSSAQNSPVNKTVPVMMEVENHSGSHNSTEELDSNTTHKRKSQKKGPGQTSCESSRIARGQSVASPLCFEFCFELHLLLGNKVLRIQASGKEAEYFLDCTISRYLSKPVVVSRTVCMLNSIMTKKPNSKPDTFGLVLKIKNSNSYDVVPNLYRTKLSKCRTLA
ncbi:uncharacterized protein LOC106663137 isoform X2 [Cimex lectularius]|uniref:Uncharacterized protein n=1 Tax=Cimex lectularius TaxID=79782 RepID=A0A8I6SG89_CIMLE|nr:uncharacterized protein LOC106663137 isoform X2 [Cimex lectularius]